MNQNALLKMQIKKIVQMILLLKQTHWNKSAMKGDVVIKKWRVLPFHGVIIKQ